MLGAGTYRSAAVNAQLIRYARAAGMREGETAACQANFKALLSMVTPWIYSYLFVARLLPRTRHTYTHTHTHTHSALARTDTLTILWIRYQRFVDTAVPGMAYLVCMAFMVLAQAATMRLSAAELGDVA